MKAVEIYHGTVHSVLSSHYKKGKVNAKLSTVKIFRYIFIVVVMDMFNILIIKTVEILFPK